MRRQLRVLLLLLAPLLLVSGVGCLYRYHSAACKKRGEAYEARYEALKRDAHEKLKIGTDKESVIRFFAEHGFPINFSQGEANGSIRVLGCAPTGCGSDDALLGLRVRIDDRGTTIAEPEVVGMYTDCL